jgi:hypothetical protein
MRGRRSAERSRSWWRRSSQSRLVRRPRVRPRQPGTRAASGPALGTLRSPREELADGPGDTGTRKRGPELRQKPKDFCREPQQGAERRAGGRIPPVISGAPEMGSAARRATGCGVPHQRLPAPCPLIFFGERKRTKGIRRPAKPDGEALAVRQKAANARNCGFPRKRKVTFLASRCPSPSAAKFSRAAKPGTAAEPTSP